MQNVVFKLGNGLLILRNQFIYLKNWKLRQAPTTIEFNILYWIFARVRDLFILFKPCVIDKTGFCKGVETRSFFILANNPNSKPDRKNPEHTSVNIRKWQLSTKFQQKLLNSMVVGARQSLQFFRKNTWFFENGRALSKFLYDILHYLINITKL